MKKGLMTICMSLLILAADAQVKITVDAGKRGPVIGSRHYGIFYEEINHAGDGGLYAELIRNRSFEDSGNPDYWWTTGTSTMTVTTDNPLNSAQQRSLKVVMKKIGDGIRNEGWWGVNIVKGETYKLSFWARSENGYEGKLRASLQNQAGTVMGYANIEVELGTEWKKYTAEIKATNNVTNGWFALTGLKAGRVQYDVISLMPPTYKDRENGCRRDLAEMLAALRPAFVRFPGGCYIEGLEGDGSHNRFEWKKTIGPIEERPGHYNRNWGYPVTDGLGFHELLQLTEDLGAEPLFVVNIGLGHEWEDQNVADYIQEALDAIEYCNGDAETTTWGKVRAQNGHPEPFNLKLLEIGNENYYFGPYNNRYGQFQNAIHKKYPEIEFIGNTGGAGEWNLSWPVDFIDQHFYETPQWFIIQYNRYDNYSRTAPKVYVGEYAVTKGYGNLGNLNAALGEAVYMLGMENNSDVCCMNSYAPIFTHENSYGWRPDMIRFNNNTSYGTPSYYVQQMMPNNLGKQNVRWTEEGNTPDDLTRSTRSIGLSTWGTTAQFDNIIVKDNSGNVLYENDFSDDDLGEWSTNGGTWRVIDGTLQQTNASMTGQLLYLTQDFGDNYTLELDATKLSGGEGFLIAFDLSDVDNFCWWNIAGWGNTKHGIEQCIAGSKSMLSEAEGTITTNQTYHLKVVVAGRNIKCYMDDKLINEANLSEQNKNKKVYVGATIDDDDNTMYVKVVNPYQQNVDAVINIKNATIKSCTLNYLSSNYGTDENSTNNQKLVSPRSKTITSQVSEDKKSINYTIPKYSLCIFKVKLQAREEQEDVEIPTPLICYSFDKSQTADDNGKYPFKHEGKGEIVTMSDQNYTYWSGTTGSLNLSKEMARDILGQLTGDYSVSIDILPTDANTLKEFCWAYGLSWSTGSYLGLVNAAGNSNWYYEIKRGTATSSFQSNSGLNINRWHNITYSQKDGIGTIYIDGYLLGTAETTIQPTDFSARITKAYLAKSPFTTDKPMSKTYFDDFKIWNSALTTEQVVTLFNQANRKATETAATSIQQLTLDADTAPNKKGIFDLQGRPVSSSDGHLPAGLYIVNGKKVLVK